MGLALAKLVPCHEMRYSIWCRLVRQGSRDGEGFRVFELHKCINDGGHKMARQSNREVCDGLHDDGEVSKLYSFTVTFTERRKDSIHHYCANLSTCTDNTKPKLNISSSYPSTFAKPKLRVETVWSRGYKPRLVKLNIRVGVRISTLLMSMYCFR